MTRTLLLAALAAALLAAAPAAEARRSVPQGFYGVMADRGIRSVPEEVAERQWDLMARSGVESVRTTFNWAHAQPVAGGAPAFGSTDRVVELAARRHIELLPVVIGTPTWAAVEPERGGESPPVNNSDYAAYLTALIGRYGPSGTFWDENPDVPRRPLRKWQIWNEPHIDGYWNPPGDDEHAWVESYAALLRDSSVAIRQADPRAKVVIAGLADYVWRHLGRLYRAGVKGSYDILALNMYTVRPVDVLRGVRLARRSLRRYRDDRRPVWLTETTWPAARGRLPRPVTAWQRAWWTTDRGMATRLRQFYRLAVKQRRAIRLQRAFWYTWSSGYDERDLFDYTGLVRTRSDAFQRTPALRAYARSARRHQGCVKTTAGTCR
jgi:polysaccharide biosynthesis protein PslG